MKFLRVIFLRKINVCTFFCRKDQSENITPLTIHPFSWYLFHVDEGVAKFTYDLWFKIDSSFLY